MQVSSPAQRAIDLYRQRLDAYVELTCEEVRALGVKFYCSLPRAALRGAVKRVFETVGVDLDRGAPDAYPALLSTLGTERASQGASVTEVTLGMYVGFEIVTEDFAARFADDPEPALFWERMRARLAYKGVAALADAYVSARERLIRSQADEILALSTRVLPLYPGVLVCPLLGRLDHERAEVMTSTVLAAVARHGARVVVLDLSGVPVVDAEAGGHLVGAARAVGLLGARPVLVGLAPAVARAIVTGAVDLGGIRTLADLASGLNDALALLGKRIVDA